MFNYCGFSFIKTYLLVLIAFLISYKKLTLSLIQQHKHAYFRIPRFINFFEINYISNSSLYLFLLLI